MTELPNIDIKNTPNIEALTSAIASQYPIFKKVIDTRKTDFGGSWTTRFEREMGIYFDGDIDAINRAADAYCSFSLEAMRLQAKFDQNLSYSTSSYDEAVSTVYSNTDYMVNTYLPALLLSHYLWPHHYRQIHWAHEHFFSRLLDLENVRFCDVGIGTGFYSKELLTTLPKSLGWGFDISPASIAHTEHILTKWHVMDRYQLCQKEVAKLEDEGFNAFVSVELLEHLEDPYEFLCMLRREVANGAVGFVTAAIDAPNRDHIYLYRDNESVAKHIERAGFEILDSINLAAYEKTTENETVPQSGCFILRAIG